MSNYQKFQNPPSYTNGDNNGPTMDAQNPYQPNAPSAATIMNMAPSSFIQKSKKELKSWSSLKMLARVEMTLALMLFTFEAIVDGTINSVDLPYHPGPCNFGTGIWVGLLGVITAGLGFGAFRTMYGNKCLIVANFVMCIICAVADGIMIIFACVCLAVLPHFMRGTYEYNPNSGRSGFKEASADTVALIRGLIALESFILFAAIAHLISSIVSTAFICRNWCQGSQPTVAVVYFPGNGSAGVNQTGEIDPCRISVPSGAQQYVILLPNGTQAVLPQNTFPPQTPQPPQPEFRNVQA